MDVLTPSQRSFNMSKIHSKNTSPEIKLRKLLSGLGVRGYRLHYKLTGKPDIVFTKKRIVIFIDGCFWHRCKKDFVQPKSRKNFWLPKIEQNLKRDNIVNRKLKKEGWKVMRIWEHEILKQKELLILKVRKALYSR